jgi:hypothetical protein
MNDLKEKREFVRTGLSVQATVKRIGKRESDRRASAKKMLSSSRHPYRTGSAAKDHTIPGAALADIAAFLIQVNEKLDRILDIVGTDRPDSGIIDVKETVNVSGSGISLVVTESIEVGQLLDVSISMPDFTMGKLMAQGEVIRVLPIHDSDTELFEVGIRFLNLTEEEREKIVAYTFRQQREHIRNQKKLG